MLVINEPANIEDMMKKKRYEAKKRVPTPGVIKVTPGDPVEASIIQVIKGDYAPFEEKKPLEKKVAKGFLEYLTKIGRNVKMISINKKDPPDFFCREGEREFGIEVTELITENDVMNQVYAEALRKKIQLPRLYVLLNTVAGKRVPELDTNKGKQLVSEMAGVIHYAKDGVGKVCGELLPYSSATTGRYFIYTIESGKASEVNWFYFSFEEPIFLQFSPSDVDYGCWKDNLIKKWQTQYGIACWLTMYSFGARPDMRKIQQIVENLNRVYGEIYEEVWFSTPYGVRGLDDVKRIY